MDSVHKSVLLKEVLYYLDVGPDKNFIDATVDGASLAEAILQKTAPKGKLLGFEWDSKLIAIAQERLKGFSNRAIIVNASYTELRVLCNKYKFSKADGIIFDFGLSSWHLEQSGRGFSFQKDEPLDMRFNAAVQKITAAEILKRYSTTELSRIFRIYGGERYANKIASYIVKQRQRAPIKTTGQLVELIGNNIPARSKFQSIHPATRVFQALRIEVNSELENIRKVLPQTLEVLKTGSRIVCISFHSLEDAIVKNFFRESDSAGKLKIITRKTIEPSDKEIKENLRSRSARLRAAEKL